MKAQWIHITIPIIAACFIVAFLFLLVQISSPLTFGDQNFIQNAQPQTVWAMRSITSTFGINSPLLILYDGQEVLVTGHGVCGSNGEWFELSATVTQNSSGAKGKGTIQGKCPGEENFSWSLAAEANGPRGFEPGAAQVCAEANVHIDKEGAIVQKWCKEVILEVE